MKLNVKKIFDYLKPVQKPEIIPAQPLYKRSFKAALPSRFIQWLNTSCCKVNADLVSQLRTLQLRSIDLAKNNQLFRSYIINTCKGVVGAQGFRLQMQIKNFDGSLNEALNDQIEWAWYQFTKKGNLQLSETLGDVDFDTQVLKSMLVNGECFIRIIKDSESKFGVKFKLIDSLCVDTLRNVPMTEGQNGIFNGIEVDHNYRPIKYYIRQGDGFGNYESGELEIVPADQIIHLYRPQFINQVRGYSPVVASLQSLKQLDDFATAELIAAKIQSCQGVFYERNNQSPVGDFMSQTVDDEGSFLQQLSPGVASVVPNGYNVKTLTPNHPNSQYGQFVKAIGKRVASSMGTNYNTLFGDLQSVNYSSLRQANIAQNAFYKEWQRFLIENWKNIQFELFLRGYLINSSTELKPSAFSKYLREYRFIGKTDASYDIAKEIIAVERSLKLGLTSHIQQIEKKGLDPQELIKDEVKWRQMCDENNLPYNWYQTSTVASLDAVQDFNDESNHPQDQTNQNNN